MPKNAIRCLFAVAILCVASAGTAQAELTRFATGQGTSAPPSFFYMDPWIQGSRIHGTNTQARNFIDVTLDSTSQTILYNQLTFWTDTVAVKSTTISELRPGTFQTVQTHATITINPVSIGVLDVGPLTLHPSFSEIDIESNIDGAKGGFSAIPLTGTFSVTRGTESASGQFAISIPIVRFNQFPRDYLYVDNHPESISLKGASDDIAQWIDWPIGQSPIKATIFSGVLDGFSAVLELQGVYFSRGYEATLSSVPLDWSPTGDFNDDGNVDAADYVLWRKKSSTATEQSAWHTHFGESTGSGGSSSNIPEPSPLVFVVAAGLILSGRRFTVRNLGVR